MSCKGVRHKMEKEPIKPVHRRQISTATIDRILSMISE